MLHLTNKNKAQKHDIHDILYTVCMCAEIIFVLLFWATTVTPCLTFCEFRQSFTGATCLVLFTMLVSKLHLEMKNFYCQQSRTGMSKSAYIMGHIQTTLILSVPDEQ